jgi:hypothetical protein
MWERIQHAACIATKKMEEIEKRLWVYKHKVCQDAESVTAQMMQAKIMPR